MPAETGKGQVFLGGAGTHGNMLSRPAIMNTRLTSEPALMRWNPYALRIEGDLLRRQRQLLLELVDPLHRNMPDTPQAQHEMGLWEGIVTMLDEIADQAHDQYGIDCLLEEQAKDFQE